MAGVKISQLQDGGTLQADDQFVIARSALSRKLAGSDLLNRFTDIDTRINGVSSTADAKFVLKVGDTMTGFLTLNADPTQNLHSVTKQYVDTKTSSLSSTADAKFVLKAGDTMTGFLTLNADPTQNLHSVTKQYVDTSIYNLSAQIPWPVQTISNVTSGTEINVFVDDSGSMTTTLPMLNTMRDYYLKNALIGFYNNSETLYNQKVKVISMGGESGPNTERCLYFLATSGTNITVPNVVNIVFQNEAGSQPDYHPSTGIFSPYATRSTKYTTDITFLRNRLAAFPTTYIRGAILQLPFTTGTDADAQNGRNFRDWLYSIKNGIGNYAGAYGLSDKSQIMYGFEVIEKAAPSYYAEVLFEALNS